MVRDLPDKLEVTEDGLPVVSEDTFLRFVKSYPISSANNDESVRVRIEEENPQIDRFLKIGMKNAPTREARAYFEMGVQAVYELLRREYSEREPINVDFS